MAEVGRQVGRHLTLFFHLFKSSRRMSTVVFTFSCTQFPFLLNTSVKEQAPVMYVKCCHSQTLLMSLSHHNQASFFGLFGFLCFGMYLKIMGDFEHPLDKRECLGFTPQS